MKRTNMIAQFKSGYLNWSHKYGIKMPKTYDIAVQLDNINGTKLSRHAWDKEIKNLQMDFDIKEEGVLAPVVY